MIYFTADTHFSSDKVLKKSRRPFNSLEEMNECIITEWNDVVNPNDTVIHLGDFGNTDILEQLEGRIMLLPGETDEYSDTSGFYKILSPGIVISVKGLKLQLVHKPRRASRGNDPDIFVLFGHIHELQKLKRNGLNVGVDCNHFKPISSTVIEYYRIITKSVLDENIFMDTCTDEEKNNDEFDLMNLFD